MPGRFKRMGDTIILPEDAYIGVIIKRAPERPDLFIRNERFIEFLHFGLADIGPTLPGINAGALVDLSVACAACIFSMQEPTIG
jgi:hypothetical protein